MILIKDPWVTHPLRGGASVCVGVCHCLRVCPCMCQISIGITGGSVRLLLWVSVRHPHVPAHYLGWNQWQRACTRGKCDRRHCIFDAKLGWTGCWAKGQRGGKHSRGKKSPKTGFSIQTTLEKEKDKESNHQSGTLDDILIFSFFPIFVLYLLKGSTKN